MRDYSDDLDDARRRLEEAGQYLRIAELRARLPQLEVEASRPDLWDDPEAARKVTTELSAATDDLAVYDDLETRIDDAATLAELGREEHDDSVTAEVEQVLADLSSTFDELELRSLLSGEHDDSAVLCEIQAGEGGADSQDWAEMLLRMELRWLESRGYDVRVEEVSPGSEAGISSAAFVASGKNAYGWVRSEHGVHRLVRMSPFNAQGKRMTAFASLKATPFLEDVPDVVIDEKDLRIDTYRSSGAGGQHVNKTDSAVRLTHLPTGVVTSCQNERSQHQNKDRAMAMLRAKLAEKQREERESELADIRGTQHSVGFGSQIRSYVLQPYQMVKDLRTEYSTGNVDAVLDGDLDAFSEAWLRLQRAESAE